MIVRTRYYPCLIIYQITYPRWKFFVYSQLSPSKGSAQVQVCVSQSLGSFRDFLVPSGHTHSPSVQVPPVQSTVPAIHSTGREWWSVRGGQPYNLTTLKGMSHGVMCIGEEWIITADQSPVPLYPAFNFGIKKNQRRTVIQTIRSSSSWNDLS